MRNLFSLLLFLASTCSAAIAQDWRLQPATSLQKLTAKQAGKLEPFTPTPVQLHAARGEWESFQCVLQAGDKPLQSIQIAPTHLATTLGEFVDKSNLQIFRENYVFVSKPSGNRRLEPLWWPDALIPLNAQPIPTLEANKAHVFWFAIKVPRDAAKGEYFGAIDFVIDGQTKSLAIELNVHEVALPPQTLRANVAVYYDVLRDWYRKDGREFSSENWALQKRRYYDFLLDYGFNAYDLPVDWNSSDARKYLQDNRVHSVRLPTLGSADFPLALQALKASNALGKTYYYRHDEPQPETHAQVLASTKQLRQIDPKLKHLVTIHPNKALKDAVDIWCPNIGDFTGVGWVDFEQLAQERKAGRETWWYTMVEPKYPYPTWLVDDDAASIRAYGWMMARWGISGWVYSMAHGWGPKPFENLQSFADTHGDGTLLYPGESVGVDGPIPSIRLMLLRDAIEDYGLWQFKDSKYRDFQKLREAQIRPFVPPVRIPWTYSPQNIIHQLSPLSSRDKKNQVEMTIDGTFGTNEWNFVKPQATNTSGNFARAKEDFIQWPQTTLRFARDKTHLYAAMRARSGAKVVADNWFAIEIAPENALERWRFVVTTNNKLVVEKRTREGQFAIEEVQWSGATKAFSGYRDVEWKIPLSLFGNAKNLRLNALRRVTHQSGAKVILRAFDDANDARQMPLFALK